MKDLEDFFFSFEICVAVSRSGGCSGGSNVTAPTLARKAATFCCAIWNFVGDLQSFLTPNADGARSNGSLLASCGIHGPNSIWPNPKSNMLQRCWALQRTRRQSDRQNPEGFRSESVPKKRTAWMTRRRKLSKLSLLALLQEKNLHFSKNQGSLNF